MDEEKHPIDTIEKAHQDSAPHPEQDWTAEEERAIVYTSTSMKKTHYKTNKTHRRKADWRVFPMLCTVFGLSLLDRTNISSAYIAGLALDLRLDIGERYNVALLVFFIGECTRGRIE